MTAYEKAEALGDAPPLAPADPAIDLGHLSRMTLGEEALEHEVLALFGRQAEILLARMENAPQAVRATFAHTLKGSARGIGAWRVAAAAHGVESSGRVADQGGAGDAALERLIAAVEEVRAEIAELVRMRPAAGVERSKR
jgi:HPt (histidine-containing phosphotransfer) domain-containing protein